MAENHLPSKSTLSDSLATNPETTTVMATALTIFKQSPGMTDDYRPVGQIISTDYSSCLVFTNDYLKETAGGIPKGALLVATNDDLAGGLSGLQDEALILQVEGVSPLPSDALHTEIKVDRFRRATGVDTPIGYDPITKGCLQEGGLECRIVGTFYRVAENLWLAADLESFESAGGMQVYKPQGHSLEEIINHLDPDRVARATNQAATFGLIGQPPSFEIGTVKYSSASHRQQKNPVKAKLLVLPTDVLAKRTAIFGQSQKGKSNAVKLIVQSIQQLQTLGSKSIGQLIFDLSGEYANANPLGPSIAEKYPSMTKLYAFGEKIGFKPLGTNFFEQPGDGLAIIQGYLRHGSKSTAADISNFLEMELNEPPADAEIGERKRWEVKVAAFQCLLYKAGFEIPEGLKVQFEANGKIRDVVDQEAGRTLTNPKFGMHVADAVTWFTAARSANRRSTLTSSSKDDWVDANLEVLLNMLVCQNRNGGYMNGWRVLVPAVHFHSTSRHKDLLDEIYSDLTDGMIVILDLSDDTRGLSERLSERIAHKILWENQQVFGQGSVPPFIQVYVEEAHHIIPKHAQLDDPWPLLAKEGSKFNIGFAYATQEVSSIHHNILANTENFYIFHLNSKAEINELAKYEDFEYFSDSIRKVDEVGLCRVRSSSSHFTVTAKLNRF